MPATDSTDENASPEKSVPDPCSACGWAHASPSCPPTNLLEGISEVLDELHDLNETLGWWAQETREDLRRVREDLDRLVDVEGPVWEGVSVLNGGLARLADEIGHRPEIDLSNLEDVLRERGRGEPRWKKKRPENGTAARSREEAAGAL